MNRSIDNVRRRFAVLCVGIFIGTTFFSGCAFHRSAEGNLVSGNRMNRPVEPVFVQSLPSTALASSSSRPLFDDTQAISRWVDPPKEVAKADPHPLPPPARRTVVRATEATFGRDVLQSQEPVLVDFYADWCGPCKRLAPDLEAIAMENERARVVKVNVDENPALAARYGVKALPSLLVFDEGKEVSRHTGAADKARLNSMLDLPHSSTSIE